jgi:hypothetical protein
MLIRQFVDNYIHERQKIDEQKFDIDSTGLVDWHQLIQTGGYYWVEYRVHSAEEMERIKPWLISRIGKDHYLFVGTGFWFDSEQNQMLFILTWK